MLPCAIDHDQQFSEWYNVILGNGLPTHDAHVCLSSKN